MKRFLLALSFFAFSLPIMAGEEVSYSVGEKTFNGYLARPANAQGQLGGVLVVHEWWGHDDYVRRRADMLAELGYVALAVDMYGDGKLADHPKQAGEFAGEVRKNKGVAEERFRAAMNLLTSQAGVSADRIGAIGYCFGGSVVLEMARLGLPLAGVASFHGSLGGLSPVESGAVKARVLVLNGADDPFVKADQIEAFKKDMEAAGADYRFVNYAGAVHSFTNPDATERGEKFNLPLAYDKMADEQSWQAMKDMFDEVLK